MFKANHKIALTLLVAGTVSSGLPARAQAATATGTMAVTATVLSVCTIVPSPLAFGNYTAAVVTGTATLTVTCTLNTPYTVALDLGTGTGATLAARKMTFGTSTLNYALYSDSARTVAWGQTVGTNTVPGNGSGLPQSLTVYGQIAANQNVPAGAYADTVTATVNY